jgi:hypothetical protein
MQIVRDTPQANGIPEILWNVKNITAVKPIRGVYFLFLNEEIVYVGQSINVHGRIQQHVSQKEKVFNRSFYQEIPEDMDLLAVEKHYILMFRPKYNYETHAKTCEPKLSPEEHADTMAYYLKRVHTPNVRPDQRLLEETITAIENGEASYHKITGR